MEEGKIKKFNNHEEEESELSRWDRIKNFAKKHKSEIAFGAVVAIATGITLVFTKHPEYGETLLLKFKDKFENGDTEVLDVSKLSNEELSCLIEEIEREVPSNDQYTGETFSARRIGEAIGLSSQQVNKMLFELGYLAGEPGNWSLTPKGEKEAVLNGDDNGYGGYAHQSWSWFEWKESIINELKNYKNKS